MPLDKSEGREDCSLHYIVHNWFGALELESMFSNAIAMFTTSLCVWLIFWGIRRKGEFDLPLDAAGQTVRWMIVGIAFMIAEQSLDPAKTIPRLISLLIGMAFLCWPNFAYYVVKPFRRNRVNPGVIPSGGMNMTLNRHAVPLTVPGIKFLCEQDGPVEREFKAHLLEYFRANLHLRAAYLVRVQYGNSPEQKVAIAFAAGEQGYAELMNSTVLEFKSMFNTSENLDVIFLTPAQEESVLAVAKPFYHEDRVRH